MTPLLERFNALCEQLRSVTDVAEREHLVSVFVTNSYWARISQDHDGPLPEVPPRRPSFAEAIAEQEMFEWLEQRDIDQGLGAAIAAMTRDELLELQREAEKSGMADALRRGVPRTTLAKFIDNLTDEQLDQLKRDAEASGLADTFRKLKDCPGDGT